MLLFVKAALVLADRKGYLGLGAMIVPWNFFEIVVHFYNLEREAHTCTHHNFSICRDEFPSLSAAS